MLSGRPAGCEPLRSKPTSSQDIHRMMNNLHAAGGSTSYHEPPNLHAIGDRFGRPDVRRVASAILPLNRIIARSTERCKLNKIHLGTCSARCFDPVPHTAIHTAKIDYKNIHSHISYWRRQQKKSHRLLCGSSSSPPAGDSTPPPTHPRIVG